MSLQLTVPLSYHSSNAYERGQVCNGCGTGGWKGKLVPDTIWFLNVREACDIHDWMYHEGKTQKDKEIADRVFHHNMRLIIEDGSWWKWLARLRKIRAFTYYTAVAKFGDSAFWANKERID